MSAASVWEVAESILDHLERDYGYTPDYLYQLVIAGKNSEAALPVLGGILMQTSHKVAEIELSNATYVPDEVEADATAELPESCGFNVEKYEQYTEDLRDALVEVMADRLVEHSPLCDAASNGKDDTQAVSYADLHAPSLHDTAFSFIHRIMRVYGNEPQTHMTIPDGAVNVSEMCLNDVAEECARACLEALER